MEIAPQRSKRSLKEGMCRWKPFTYKWGERRVQDSCASVEGNLQRLICRRGPHQTGITVENILSMLIVVVMTASVVSVGYGIVQRFWPNLLFN
jgi:hypothetical protein